MKQIFILLLLFLCSLSIRLHAQDNLLTNKEIVEMLELGFEEDLIITKIETSHTNFNTEISELKKLKEKGASSKIISAMMMQEKEELADEKIRSGIYFMTNGEMIKILPNVFSASQTNTLAAGLTYGIASAKVKSIINNKCSRNVINNDLPAFYFYFAPADVNSLSSRADLTGGSKQQHLQMSLFL